MLAAESALLAGAALVILIVAVCLSVAVLVPRWDLRVSDATFGKIHEQPTAVEAYKAAALVRRSQVKLARATGDIKMDRLTTASIATLIALGLLARAALAAVTSNVMKMVGL